MSEKSSGKLGKKDLLILASILFATVLYIFLGNRYRLLFLAAVVLLFLRLLSLIRRLESRRLETLFFFITLAGAVTLGVRRDYIGAVVFLVFALIIFKKRFLWKIRNRLIVAGLFFTVTPIVLVTLLFLLVVNIIIYQYNSVIFENTMNDRLKNLERTTNNLFTFGEPQRIVSELSYLNDAKSLYPKPPFMSIIFFQKREGRFQPFFQYPATSELLTLDIPRLGKGFTSGYFRYHGRLYVGQWVQKDLLAALLAERISQEYLDQLPKIGDFRVQYIQPERSMISGSKAKPQLKIEAREIEQVEGFDSYSFPAPYTFKYLDFDDAESGRATTKYSMFFLINDYSKIFRTLKSSDKDKVIRGQIARLESELRKAGGSPERAAKERELDELRKESEALRRGAQRTSDFSISTLIRVLIILFGFVIVVSLFIGMRIIRVITKSVDQLTKGTEKIRRGDFSARIHIRSHDQLHMLAESFNEMAAGIDHLLSEEKEKERLEEELRIARSIQLKLLPPDHFLCPEFEIAAVNIPAAEIAGDYFDYFYLPEGHLSALVADVSGKGASAAFYMAELKGVMNYLQQKGDSPAAIIAECHNSLLSTFDKATFITMNVARFDLAKRKLVFARSGHCPILYFDHSRRQCLELTPRGMAIGLPGFSREQVEEVVIDFDAGDILLFFSDGLSEIMNKDDRPLGVERLGQLLTEFADRSAEQIKQGFLDAAVAYGDCGTKADDMTFIVVKVR